MSQYPIEIDWSDVVQKLSLDLMAAHKDIAMRYAMCESLKRRIAELEKAAKTSDS